MVPLVVASRYMFYMKDKVSISWFISISIQPNCCPNKYYKFCSNVLVTL